MALDVGPLLAAVRAWAEDVVDEATQTLVRDVEAAAPVGEGDHDGPRLRDSVRPEVQGLRGEVIVDAEHGVYLEEGTDPHEITGNPLLAFEMDGELVIVHSVQHPGSRVHVGWFTNVAEEDGWQRALDDAAARVPFG